jgi:hypothetical protein
MGVSIGQGFVPVHLHNNNVYMANNSDISNDFTIISDSNNLNEWRMAGEGKFVERRRKKKNKALFYNRKEEWDYYGMQRNCITILYLD